MLESRLARTSIAAAMIAVVWVAGSIGLAQYTEDLCFDDAEASGYGGYTQTMRAWPPTLTCGLRGGPDQADLDVEHRALGTAIVTWRFIVPPLAVIGLLVLVVAPLGTGTAPTRS